MGCNKVQYDSYKEAKSASVGLAKRKKQKMNVYKCDHCDKFHMTTSAKSTLHPVKGDKYPIDVDVVGRKKSESHKMSPIPKILAPKAECFATGKMMDSDTANKLKALFLPNSEQNDAECDATKSN